MDNNNEFDAVWQLMEEAIRECQDISDASLKFWFSNFKIKSITDDCAVFSVENNLKYSIVKNKYLPILEKHLSLIIGYTPECSLIVDSDTLNNSSFQDDRTVISPVEIAKKNKELRIEAQNKANSMGIGVLSEDFYSYDKFGRITTDIDEALVILKNKLQTQNDQKQFHNDNISPLSEGDFMKNMAREHISSSIGEDEAVYRSSSEVGEKRLTYNADYTFENFITGNSNRFARAAAISVAEKPAGVYNPLFIYGPSGVGKTHLMYAITNSILEKKPDMNIIYVKGEEFTVQLIDAISHQKTAAFREKYRKADMLLIDDVQFIAGKESTQEEFFHTFNALYEDKKQIILTSDRPPKDMLLLEDRIKSRFLSGLLADIQLPDYELRLAILKNKALLVGLDMTPEMEKFLAEKLNSNIRQIEGVIKKLCAITFLTGQGLTMEKVRSTISDFLNETRSTDEKVKRIIELTAKHYGIPEKEIIGQKRTRDIQTARNVAMYIIRKLTGMSLPQIGLYFNRNHATVHSNCATVEKAIEADPSIMSEIEDIERAASI